MQITGINEQGVATGIGTGRAHNSPMQRVGNTPNQKRRSELRQDDHPFISVEVNRSELASRIADDKQAGMTDEQAWARRLDETVKAGIVRATAAQTITGTKPLETFASIFPSISTGFAIENAARATLRRMVLHRLESLTER